MKSAENYGMDIWSSTDDGRDVVLSRFAPEWIYPGTHPYGEGAERFPIPQEEWADLWRLWGAENPYGPIPADSW